MWYARVLEIIGQTIVGDGITCLMLPRKHWLLWVDAFQGCRLGAISFYGTQTVPK